jgi:hypothetical protein
MPITRPTGDQLLFESSKTGAHILDAYLEDAEKGPRTLGSLLADLFTDTGLLRQLTQVRANPTTKEVEVRFGNFVDPAASWNATGVFVPRFLGPWASSVLYRQGDYVIVSGSPTVCSETHTSGLAPDPAKFYTLSGGGGGTSTPGIAQTSTYNAAANGKCVVIDGGSISVVSLPAETTITVLNTSLLSNTLLVQPAGMQLFRGGTSGTGNRVIANKGIATIYYQTSTIAIVNGNVS